MGTAWRNGEIGMESVQNIKVYPNIGILQERRIVLHKVTDRESECSTGLSWDEAMRMPPITKEWADDCEKIDHSDRPDPE